MTSTKKSSFKQSFFERVAIKVDGVSFFSSFPTIDAISPWFFLSHIVNQMIAELWMKWRNFVFQFGGMTLSLCRLDFNFS